MCKDWHPISVQGVLHTSASNLATCDFCYCRLIYSTRMVADRHRLAARHNKHCWRAFQGYKHRWPWTTLNPKNMGFKWFFCYFRLRRTLRENFRWNILKIDQDNLRTKLTVPSCCKACMHVYQARLRPGGSSKASCCCRKSIPSMTSLTCGDTSPSVCIWWLPATASTVAAPVTLIAVYHLPLAVVDEWEPAAVKLRRLKDRSRVQTTATYLSVDLKPQL